LVLTEDMLLRSSTAVVSGTSLAHCYARVLLGQILRCILLPLQAGIRENAWPCGHAATISSPS
jgi:hypothetical protein